MTDWQNNSYGMNETEIRQAFAKCFMSGEGRKVLSFLRKITVERSLGANATDNELRYLEGQRQLVKKIETLALGNN